MKQIELSFPTAMSLNVMSSSGADEELETETIESDPVDDALGMSDEDFANANPDDFETSAEPAGDEEEQNEEQEQEQEQTNEDALGDESNDVESTDSANQEEKPDNAEEGGSEEAEAGDEAEDNQPSEENEESTINYEAEFQKLFGEPIKAGGRMTHLRNTEHAKSLIEMGIDYNKKMHGLKPHMKTLRTLEKEGLLGEGKEERLNLLLEVEKGNPNAIKRFIAESGIDLLDLADEDAIEAGRTYQPENHMVSEQEVEIEDALKSISGTDTYQKTLDVMTKTFDQKSRELISENPRYIVALNQDMENGVYDQVMDAVQYQRDMNLIPAGVSDMEAYINTVQEISAQKAPKQPARQEQTRQPNPTQAQPNPKARQETRRRKVSMSSSKTTSKRVEPNYDPLSMSDEDFMKIEGMNIL